METAGYVLYHESIFVQVKEEKNGVIKWKEKTKSGTFSSQTIAYIFLHSDGQFYQNGLITTIQYRKPMTMPYLIITFNHKVESYLDAPKEHNQLQSPNCQVWSVFC